MRPPPDRECHILRLPYELLKPIIADLSQRDQLSIATTCVHLWELAYPMAYDRIIVQASPTIADIVWRNLASGVCLRYVRHLEFAFPGQSIMDAETLYRAADTVVGILLAALRRHQLLSFSLIHPTCTTSMMSTKNMILLLETQQQLNRIDLPGIRGSGGICIDDYLPKSVRFHQLRDITFQICTGNASESLNSFIAHNSPSLNSLHLRLSTAGQATLSCIFTTPTGTPLCRKILFSMATKLTIHGYDFENIRTSPSIPTFPALRALAVVGCQNVWYFCLYAQPERLPELRALMVTMTDIMSGGIFADFIERLRPLRELIFHGKHMLFYDSSSIRSHAETLEILSLHNKAFGKVFAYHDDMYSTLSTLKALRHFSCHMGSFDCGMISGVKNYEKDAVAKLYANVTACDRLKTLGLHCTSYVSPEYDHRIEYNSWLHLKRSYFTNEEISLVLDRAHSEKLIRDAIFSRSIHGIPEDDKTALEYVAVAVQSDLPYPSVPTGAMERITQAQQVPKNIMSFQPKQGLRSADQVKKEMRASYAGDNYYFLEAYIDTITEESPVKFIGR